MKKWINLSIIFFVIFTLACNGKQDTSQKGGDKPVSITVMGDGQTAWTRNFNPFTNTKHSVYFTLEPLVIFNAMQNGEEIMWLAEDIISHDDLKTITVKVRQGVLWSDGEPFNAEDVAFSFTYSKNHPEIDGGGSWGDNGKLKSVTVIDPHTVEIVLQEANAFARTDIFNEAYMIPKHIWANIEEPASEVVENLVGTGPFTEVLQFSPQLYIMGRNPHYWKNDDLAIDQMVHPQFNGNETVYDTLKAGNVDWANIFVPDVEKVYVAGNPDNKYWFPSNDSVRVTFNFQSPNENNRKAFNNINFRRAASLAMDRQAMMEIGAYGYVKGGNPATGLPPTLWDWRNNEADAIYAPYYNYDIEAAKAELELGGFKDVDADGFLENSDGTPIEFDIIVPTGWTDWVNNTQIAVEGLRAIGINASLRTPETAAYAEAWDTGEFDSYFGANGLANNIWQFYNTTMHSRYFRTPNWWASNMTNYENYERDNLIEELSITGDKKRQRTITDAIELLYAQEIPQVNLYYNGIWNLYNTARFEGWASEENPYIGPSLVDHDNKLYHLLHLRPKK